MLKKIVYASVVLAGISVSCLASAVTENRDVSQPIVAPKKESANTVSGTVEDTVVVPVVEALAFRPWVVTIHFSPLDLVLPNKLGASVARRDTETSMWEFEYTHGSFTPFFIDDLGKFSEDRFSILRRFTARANSGFQWFYGAFYHRFKLEIGNAMLQRLSGGVYPSTSVVDIGGIGATIGLGYRWLIKEQFVLGVDGIAWSQPLKTTNRDTRFLDAVSDRGDRDKLETGIRVMEYFPRFATLKLTAGYSF